jgi:type IV secretory pathway TraG/TraD family ATPase VirD4
MPFLPRIILLLVGCVAMLFGCDKTPRAFGEVSRRYEAWGWTGTLNVETGSIPSSFVLRCWFRSQYCKEAKQYWGDVFYEAGPVIFVSGPSGFLLMLIGVLSRPKKRPVKDGGLANFATTKHTRLFRKETTEGHLVGYIGFDKYGRMLRLPAKIRNKHTGVKARTGAGKTGNYILPNIYLDTLECQHIVIVLDIKYPQTEGGLAGTPVIAHRSGLPTYVITPYEDSSFHLPVLDMVSDWKSSKVLAEMFYPSGTPGENNFYLGNKQELLSALLLAQAYKGGSIGKVANILLGGKAAYDNFVASYKTDDGDLQGKLRAFLKLSGEDQETIIKDISKRLTDFIIPNLARHLGRSEVSSLNFDPQVAFKEPCFIYVGLDGEVIKTEGGEAILRLIKSYLETMLSRIAAHSPGGVLPVPVSIYMDEFLNMPLFPRIRHDVGTIRSANVGYHFSIHGDSNGIALYGREWTAIMDNINTLIYLPQYVPGSERENVAKLIGRTTTRDVTKSKSYNNNFGRNRGMTERDVTRPLVPLEEMRTWNKYEGVVDVEQSQPILVVMPHVGVKRIPGIRFRPFGIKNPFYPIFSSVPEKFDVRAWVEGIVALEYVKHFDVARRNVGDGDLPRVEESQAPLLPTDRVVQITETVLPTPTPQPVNPQLTEFVLAWLKQGLPIEVSAKRLFIFRLVHLPDDLVTTLRFANLVEQGHLDQDGEKLMLTKQQSQTLDQGLVRRLEALVAEQRLKDDTLGVVTIRFQQTVNVPQPSLTEPAAPPREKQRAIEVSLPVTSPKKRSVKFKSLTPQQAADLRTWVATSSKVLNHPQGGEQGLTWKTCEGRYVADGKIHLKLTTFAKLFKIPTSSVTKKTLEGEHYVELQF